MKNHLPVLIFLLFSFASSAQTTLPMEDESFLTITDCDSLTITADPYSSPNLYTTELTYPGLTGVTVTINPDYFGQRWDVDANSELRFYDGFDESAQLLGSYNTIDYPNGFLLNMNVEFLRIEFEIGEESSGDGFEMAVICSDDLQGLPLTKMKLSLNENWSFNTALNLNVLHTCLNDTFNVSLDPVSLDPQSENQNLDSMLIKWALGDQTFIRGIGMSSIEHAYNYGSGYLVTVFSYGLSQLQFLVQNSPQPEFTLEENLVFCQNEPTQVLGGMNEGEVVGADLSLGGISITEFHGTGLYLPDGNNENYTTSIEVSGFPDGATVSSASDLTAFCINMEHSYLGDLEMMLTCPDGTEVNIFNSYTGDGLFPGGFGGGPAFLGDANDEQSGFPVPGIGFDYCFSNVVNEYSTMAEEFASGNTVPVSTFSFGGNAMASGIYQPEESFESFIGCPLNGEWILSVRDNIGVDDGFIFDWSLGFSEDLIVGFYQNELISAAWENNDWITAVNAGSIEVTPTNTNPVDLVFNVTDDYGCTFSKVLTVQVSDTLAAIEEAEICNFTYEIEWPNAAGDIALVAGPSSNVMVSNSGNHFEIEVPVAGDYTFAFNYYDCSNAPEAHLTFLEENDPACITGFEEIDLAGNLVLAPNPTRNIFHLIFELHTAQQVQISIATVQGKVVLKQKYNVSVGSQTKEVAMGKFENGTYLITLKGETFKTSRVLIKQ